MRTRRPEGSIRRRADGRYEVRVQTGINYNTGAPIRKSVYAHTEEEAQRLLYGLLADPGQAIKHVGDDCTLNEWLECCGLMLPIMSSNQPLQVTVHMFKSTSRRYSVNRSCATYPLENCMNFTILSRNPKD